MRAMLALAPVAAFVVALLAARLLLTPAGRRLALDEPNERSLHAHPVPRTGGIAIVAGVAAACAFIQPVVVVTLVVALALAALSFVDDVVGLPTLARLAAHVAAAAVVLVYQLGYAEPVLFALFVLAIAWYENLYNFMDGSDGLAGGMALFGFGAYAIAAHSSGADAYAGLCGSIAAAAAGFLVFNFPPARLFMGDVGSVPIGFLAGALGVVGWGRGYWPIWFPLLVFAPFVCDATLTLLRRLLRRERVWQAHREHYYQRLVRMGFGHRGTAFIEYGAMAGCAAVALLARREPAVVQAVALAIAAAALIAVALWVDLRWARHARAASETVR
jgi:UDP-N-acetylmuramyl pentapeptide phosphotransferase/UDP-N-acetylglucosamine-1-phosphate transferase